MSPHRAGRRDSHRAAQVAEEPDGKDDTPAFELAERGQTQPGGAEGSADRPIVAYLVDVELEYVLERDDVCLHPLDLGDRGHTPGAVFEPLEMHEQIEC